MQAHNKLVCKKLGICPTLKFKKNYSLISVNFNSSACKCLFLISQTIGWDGSQEITELILKDKEHIYHWQWIPSYGGYEGVIMNMKSPPKQNHTQSQFWDPALNLVKE